ncbi:MAG TPA: hypothetical protein VFG11_09280 [Acidobacteriota bacterium]|nr:hypothetical protein [Acidobacteriota bacterium]
MSWFGRLEGKLEKYAIPNVTIGLIGLQIVLFVLSMAQPGILQAAYLIPSLVLKGQLWRLVTFLVVPPQMHPIFLFFFWYLFFLMGNALEHQWGTFRYNCYLLIGYLATVAAAFIVAPNQPSSNAFLQGSVFLAFAFLFPDFQLYIFFILPIKVKWLALLTWLGYAYTLLFGDWPTRSLVIASILNFLIFFGSDIQDRIRTGRRHMASQASQFGNRKSESQPFHRCAVCGITDQTHPDMDFRYCPQCKGTLGYCTDHIRSHEHVT